MKNRFTVFDIETDSLDAKKIHCLSYQIYKDNYLLSKGTLVSTQEIASFILKQDILVGHNIIRFDIPVIERLCDVKIKAKVIDTLGLSFTLFPFRGRKHGLGAWGETLKVVKPVIEDWKNLTLEQYKYRCEQDVEINQLLFHKQWNILLYLYSGNIDNIFRYIGYLNFKLDCLKAHESIKLKLNRQLCEITKLKLENAFAEKVIVLSKAMPSCLGKVLRTKPVNLYKKNGELSVAGHKWFNFLAETNTSPVVKEVREEPNPTSPLQLKEWLTLLGWKPKTFKLSKQTGENIPQVSLPFGQGICPSVKVLAEKEPAIKELEGLYVIRHRIGLLKSFLAAADENDMIYCNAHGFTNTLRLQHSKPLANLPGVDKPYGKEIRGCITVPSDDYIMCGADVSGLEDNTKQHYIYMFDPDYVNEMRVPGFDPHLDIGILSGLITPKEAEFYKSYDGNSEDADKYATIKKKRHTAKTINFSATYGAGPHKIAATAGISLDEAKKLHSIYWQRNKAVKETANSCQIKSMSTMKWLYNPVSGFWYYLKEEKDIFSTLNQSTGVYFFDFWVKKCREGLKPLDIDIPFQYHDEILPWFLKTRQNKVAEILYTAIKETNKEIKLNVEIDISVNFGNNYAECH